MDPVRPIRRVARVEYRPYRRLGAGGHGGQCVIDVFTARGLVAQGGRAAQVGLRVEDDQEFGCPAVGRGLQ